MTRHVLAVVLLAGFAQAAAAQQEFPSPDAAADALSAAVAKHDTTAIDRILGPDYAEFRRGQKADEALSRYRGERFVSAIAEYRSLWPEGDDRMTLIVGAAGWPFPVPIVRAGDVWQFDGSEGVEELRNRLIGANELNAIAVMDTLVHAQNVYASVDRDGDGVLEYAERLRSTDGTHDGLYWGSEEAGGEPSPLSELKELADSVLGEVRKDAPFLGYRYRALHAQGKNANAGAFDYRINGHMVAGFAFLAWPADYGDTGVMTFMVNRNGIVYQRDLGEDTEEQARQISAFDPAQGWQAVDDDTVAITLP